MNQPLCNVEELVSDYVGPGGDPSDSNVRDECILLPARELDDDNGGTIDRFELKLLHMILELNPEMRLDYAREEHIVCKTESS